MPTNDNNGNHPVDPFGPSEAEIERPPRVAPYAAVGLSTTVRGISKRSDCWVNLRHLANMIHGTMFTTSIFFPIKILALAKGGDHGIHGRGLRHGPRGRGEGTLPGHPRGGDESFGEPPSSTTPTSSRSRKPAGRR